LIVAQQTAYQGQTLPSIVVRAHPLVAVGGLRANDQKIVDADLLVIGGRLDAFDRGLKKLDGLVASKYFESTVE